jgi:hypothetical protein
VTMNSEGSVSKQDQGLASNSDPQCANYLQYNIKASQWIVLITLIKLTNVHNFDALLLLQEIQNERNVVQLLCTHCWFLVVAWQVAPGKNLW